MNTIDPEEKVVCPFNSSHHIMRKRLQVHIVKCQRNYPDVKLVECDFNSLHKVLEAELKYHHDHCPDKKVIEVGTYLENESDLTKFPVRNIDVPADESWDNLPPVKSYDPQKYIENKPIIRKCDVLSAAKRRELKMNERKRFIGLQNQSTTQSQSEKKKQSKPTEPVGLPTPHQSQGTVKYLDHIPQLMEKINKKTEACVYIAED